VIKTYTASAAAISWIDSRTGLPEVDVAPPGPTVLRSFITGNSGYRFANFLDVTVNFDDVRRTIVGQSVTAQNGIYRAPSFAHLPSWNFPVTTNVATGSEPLRFTQNTGARTISPEMIGGAVGAGLGIAGGAWAGGAIGSAGGPIGTVGGAVIGAIVGGIAGEITAHQVTGFPPIWSELKISIFNDGRATIELLRHSLFPSLSFYVPDPSTPNTYIRTPVAGGATFYDGMPNLARWKAEGWGPMRGGTTSGPTPGNPWGDTHGLM